MTVREFEADARLSDSRFLGFVTIRLEDGRVTVSGPRAKAADYHRRSIILFISAAVAIAAFTLFAVTSLPLLGGVAAAGTGVWILAVFIGRLWLRFGSSEDALVFDWHAIESLDMRNGPTYWDYALLGVFASAMRGPSRLGMVVRLSGDESVTFMFTMRDEKDLARLYSLLADEEDAA